MASSSPYDTALAATPGLTNSWFWRDLTGTTATATTGAVNGTTSGAVGLQVVSPLARDSSTPLGQYNDVVAGVHFGATMGPNAPTIGSVSMGNQFEYTALTPFSAAFFIRLRGDQSSSYTWAEMEVIDKSTTGPRTGWDVAVTASRQIVFRRWLADSNTNNTVTSVAVLTPQIWYFVCVTFDGVNYRVYVDDGAVAITTPAAGPFSLTTNSANFTVGARVGGATVGLDADVGPLAMFNRAIASSEVLALFNAAFVTTPRTFYVDPAGSDTYDGTSATFVSGTTGPWATFNKAAASLQAGDTAEFALGTYVETTTRAFSAMAYSGTKRSGITFRPTQAVLNTLTTGQPPAQTLSLPTIQFGTLSTGTAVATITGGSWTAGVTTYTVASTSGLVAGQSYISATGQTGNTLYNVADALVVSLVANTSVSIKMASTPGTWTGGGTPAMTTGIDLSNAQKVHILQQCYHSIRGLYFTQPLMGSDYNDRLVAFFGQQAATSVGTVTAATVSSGLVTYTATAHGLLAGRVVNISGLGSTGGSYNFTNGNIISATTNAFVVAVSTASGTPSGTGWLTTEQQGEVQTLTVTAGATGTFNVTFPGNYTTTPSNATITGLSVTATAATIQTALRASTSLAATGAGALTNAICTGGPLGTAAVTVVFAANQQNPYAVGPMPLMTVTQPTTGTSSVARTTAGSNGTRWYQSADFCTLEYCRISNAYQPYKSSVDTGSTFQYNYVHACNVAIGCYNSNAPVFQGNIFLMDGTGQALRNGGNLNQSDCIQSKGGTRNAAIYNNVVRVPVGAIPLTGAAYYIGGGSNDMNGEYDASTSGKEGYNNICYNNVAIAEYAGGIQFAGYSIAGGQNDTVANNVAINCSTACRISWGGNWPTIQTGTTTAVHVKADTPTVVNNVWYSAPVYQGSTTAITESGTTATYTVVNTLAAGQLVTVRGAFPNEYNVANAVVATASASQFTVAGLPASLTTPATTQGAVYTGTGTGFKFNAGQSSDMTGILTYSNNLRYFMANVDDTIGSGSVAANEIGANVTDPLFVSYLSDWRTSPGSPVSQAGLQVTRTAFGQGYLGRIALSMALDVIGEARTSTPDLGIYAASLGAETIVNTGLSTGALVDTINVGGAVRQVMILGDPTQQGYVQRVLPTDPTYTDMGAIVRLVPMRASSATVTVVASNASNVTLLASNPAAKARIINNTATGILYVKFGATASTSSFTVQLTTNAYYEFPQPLYTGRVDGIWSSAGGGNAVMTEET